MLPIDDLDSVMQAQGFIKKIAAKDIEDVTKVVDPATGTVTSPGITTPSLIALCAGKKNDNGTLDRNTVQNALKLNGVNADEYLLQEDKELLTKIIEAVSSAHSDEIQLLRDEIYHLKSELVRTGHVEDTFVADGYIDGFKKGNVKYDESKTAIENIVGLNITQSEKIFDKNDWLVVRKDESNEQSNALATVTKESNNDIQLDISTANLSVEKTKLLKTLGEYNRGTYSYSKVDYGTPSTKENYTMLNDDSNVSKLKLTENNTGFATMLKIPNRCAGFLTKFAINGKAYGNPGALVCYAVKGGAEYIAEVASAGLERIKRDGNLIATSATVNATDVVDGEIVFDFTRLDYNINDASSTLYPEVSGTEYCFIIEADNVSNHDCWEFEFGHKKSTLSDLQTNNRTYKFYNKEVITAKDAFVEVEDIDMLYVVTTRAKEDESEIPYSVGLYTTLKPISISKPIKASRARLTLEVNKEGNFVCASHGQIKAEVDAISYRKADGTYAEQTVLGGGDDLIIGNTIVKVKTSSPNTVTIDKSIYVEPLMPIYRCGHKAQLKTYLVEEDENGYPSVVAGSEKVMQLELKAVIPSGRDVSSSISDRLIFEVDMDSIKNEGEVYYFNKAELQIKWSSFLSSEIIHTQSLKGNDYVGRIHNMSLAFDKLV